MDLHRMIVTEMHRAVPKSCYDYWAEALPASIQRNPSILKHFSGIALGMGDFLIRTGEAMQRAAKHEPLTPKSSDALYSHQ